MLNVKTVDKPSYLFLRIHEKNTLTFSMSELLGSAGKLIDLRLKNDLVDIFNVEVEQAMVKQYPKKSRPLCNDEGKKRLSSFITRN